jgi:hypothetical protein
MWAKYWMSHKHMKSNVAVLLKTSSLQISVVAKFSLSDALELGEGGVGEDSCILHILPFYVNLYWLLGHNKLLIYKTILKQICTYGIQLWGTASTSNIEILERFQSKAWCMIVDAPW